MVFIILQGCFPCSNVSIIRECECTNGTYGSYYAWEYTKIRLVVLVRGICPSKLILDVARTMTHVLLILRLTWLLFDPTLLIQPPFSLMWSCLVLETSSQPYIVCMNALSASKFTLVINVYIEWNGYFTLQTVSTIRLHWDFSRPRWVTIGSDCG